MALDQQRDALQIDQVIIVEGEVSIDDYSGGFKLSAKNVWSIDEWRSRLAKAVVLEITEEQMQHGLLEQLSQQLQNYKNGTCPLVIEYVRADYRAQLPLGKDWRVQPSDALLDVIEALVGEERVKVVYS